MSETFNGYHVWLGIPPNEQPPNHYRLLGIAAFEADLDVIDHAADRQMAHVRTFQSGRHGALSQQILNELSAARLCLLNAEKKAQYDEQLKGRLNVGTASPILVAKPLPVARPVARPVSPSSPGGVKPAGVKPALANPASPAVGSPLVRPKTVGATADVLPGVVVPKIDDAVSLDMDSSAPYGTGASMQIRVKRRRYKRDNSWQSAALVGSLAGIVVIISVVLYYSLRGLDWNQVLQGQFGPPTTSESSSGPAAAPPQAPPPPG
jgi:hypothetical protein